jgi:hypothetical protein
MPAEFRNHQIELTATPAGLRLDAALAWHCYCSVAH